AHTTTGCGKQGFPSAQPYLSHTPGANPFCCMFFDQVVARPGALNSTTRKRLAPAGIALGRTQFILDTDGGARLPSYTMLSFAG
ncbi:hypothetical protein BO99DRAFT_464461, partial [Aspergillus violaceofuscus CBS 115571]